MPLRAETGGTTEDITTALQSILGSPTVAPSTSTAPALQATSAPLVSTTPNPGTGIALDINGKLPSSIPIPGTGLAYSEYTSPATITATVEASADTVVTASAIVFDGSTSVWIEFYTPRLERGTTFIQCLLFDNGSSLGTMGNTLIGPGHCPGPLKRRLTPSQGKHIFSIRSSVDAGTGKIQAGPGGAGNWVPGYILISRA